MNPDWISITIALAIAGGVLLVHWRGRHAGTAAAKPDRQINKLFAEVRAMKESLGQTATTADLERIGAEMKRVEGAAASAGMVVALEGKLNRMEERLKGNSETLEAKIDSVAQAATRTEAMVQRIEGNLLRKAFDGK